MNPPPKQHVAEPLVSALRAKGFNAHVGEPDRPDHNDVHVHAVNREEAMAISEQLHRTWRRKASFQNGTYLHSTDDGGLIAVSVKRPKGALPAKFNYLLNPKPKQAITKKSAFLSGFLMKAAREFVRIIVTDNKGRKLEHHYLNAKKWGAPQGKVEKGESVENAMAREFLERTGHSIKAIPKLKRVIQDGADNIHVFEASADHIKRVQPPQTEIRWKR